MTHLQAALAEGPQAPGQCHGREVVDRHERMFVLLQESESDVWIVHAGEQ